MSLLVLDTSAIIAFAAGSVDVGETISEVHADSGHVVLPVVCLVDAARRADEQMLRVLADHPVCEVPPLPGHLWLALAAGTRILGRLDLALALMIATTGDGYVLTSEPESYGSLGEDSIISF